MNIHTIKNKDFQFSVKKTGAELCSFKSLRSHTEYIWTAEPDIWESHAPNLFPIIGSLKEGSFLYQGKEYSCPKHGFIRNNPSISLIEKTVDSVTFGLKYSDETLAVYPFKFEFKIKYTLLKSTLEVQHSIINHGGDIMLFSLGGHPGFTCPIHDNETYSDYYLEFEKPETAETWRVLEDGLIGRKTFPAFDEPTKINLHSAIFKDDALIFKNLASSTVSLKSKKSTQALTMEFRDFPYLGIWSKPDASYVCIEPWMGIADSVDTDRNIENKEGMVYLNAKEEFSASYRITIKEHN